MRVKAVLPRDRTTFWELLSLRLEVGHLDRLPVEHRATADQSTNCGHDKAWRDQNRAMMGHET
jgi:hypothetical protein